MSEPGHDVAGRITQALKSALSPESLEVVDESYKHAGHAHVITRPGTAGSVGGTHFKINVVSEAFRGKSRIDRHRAINAALAPEMGPGGIHAIAIDARAPGE
ncbi:MAG: BolA family transcriptional regulator [Beijerinckiaceae bacterium]|nr:BolA family transcriptional regulator [Beijerinckiaceae bacterium]